jgi:hypothetical protein
MAPQVRGLDAVRDVGWSGALTSSLARRVTAPMGRGDVSARIEYAIDLGELKRVLKIIFGKLFVRGTMRRLKTMFSARARASTVIAG